ncbi:hypothetical protein FRB96_002615 [Tulasnella sp. 330]|nr:hypothetical protein FRB96_002615 [Tulasnella sp. 330]
MPPKQAPKRRVCDFHQQGRCRRGEQCKNDHVGPPGGGRGNAGASTSAGQTSSPNKSIQSPARPPDVRVPYGACRSFFTSGKCGFKECKFQHVSADAAGEQGTGDGSDRARQPPARTPNSALPPGVCREYYDTGECGRSFDCRFKHVQAPSSEPQPDSEQGPFTAPANTSQPQHSNVNAGSSGKAMTPIEVHNALSRFQRPNFQFFTSLDVYTFVAALNSAKEINPGWELSDGNLLLKTVGDPANNVFTLVDKVIRHDNVSVTAGRSRELLSFQRGYMPLISVRNSTPPSRMVCQLMDFKQYFSSTFVIRSTLHPSINALYGLIDVNFDHLALVLEKCMQTSIGQRCFSEPESTVNGLNVFRDITICLNQYASTFKQAVSSHPSFAPLARNLAVWFTQWEESILSGHPGFDDDEIRELTGDRKQFMVTQTRKSIASLVDLVDCAEGYTNRIQERGKSSKSAVGKAAALLTALELNYEGPGQHRPEGPRHDNDAADVVDIRIAPTHEELCSPVLPYLPANVPGGPHHLPGDSMARLIDIQFRLLREELIAPIRSSIKNVMEALHEPPSQKPSSLSKLLAGEGGLHKSQDGMDSVMFSVYTGVTFRGMACDTRNGLSIEVSFNAPTGKARNPNAAARAAYWESVGRKRLMQGGLVALIWEGAGEGDTTIYLGSVTSSLKDLVQSTKKTHESLGLHLSFFDSEAGVRMLTSLQRGPSHMDGRKYLVEAPIMFESIRPFLETLKNASPSSIPLAKYLVHPDNGSLKGVSIDLPLYASQPGYSMDLSCLCDESTRLTLRPSDRGSVVATRARLKTESRLDPSQADALLDTLLSEVSLIQGPPGTGKSFTGIRILQVLIANNVGPILLIAFTNHALDNILAHVLEENITSKVVRLGSRSADEVVSEYSLDNVLKNHGRSQMAKASGREYRNLKVMEEEMTELMGKIINRDVPQNDMLQHIALEHPTHHDELIHPPYWVQKLFEDSLSEGWQTAGRKTAIALPDFWLQGSDLDYITPPVEKVAEPKRSRRKGKGKARAGPAPPNRFEFPEEQGEPHGLTDYQMQLAEWAQNVYEFFIKLGRPGIPPAPSTSREVNALLQDWNVWSMSRQERNDLQAFWTEEVREMSYAKQTMEFERLKANHAEARTRWEGMRDQSKLEVLSKADLIGCTTNGAAKLTSLLTSVAPKVLLVEEAGQVLEAHILASLVPSIEQLILIGDPQQLRPTIANYYLSIDNKRTGLTYRFDQSLMERLFKMELSMSRLDVQRRMRPSIANLIRSTLYPHLEDHIIVQKYPPVRGMSQNVFFFDHQHAEEGGGEESVSKSNNFELQKIRAALAKEVTTVIDERDAVQLVDHEDHEGQDFTAALAPGGTAKSIQVSQQVLLRTVDNFQGEEGTIVILSLVRNSGTSQTPRKGGIGFLKSENRTNVALSRARHGMYILGNSEDLSSQSGMWQKIVQELKERDCLGPAFSIACHRHPQTVTLVDTPGQLSMHAPDGTPNLVATPHMSYHSQINQGDAYFHAMLAWLAVITALTNAILTTSSISTPVARASALDYVPGSTHARRGAPNPVVNARLKCHACWRAGMLTGYHAGSLIAWKMFPVLRWWRGNFLHTQRKSCARLCATVTWNAATSSVSPNAAVVKIITQAVKGAVHVSPPESSMRITLVPGRCTANISVAAIARKVMTARRSPAKSHVAKGVSIIGASCGARCLALPVWSLANGAAIITHAPCRAVLLAPAFHATFAAAKLSCAAIAVLLCGPASGNDQVVDYIMMTKLSEIDPHGEELDTMVMTLACGHIFTVETLDGICELGKYYTQSGQGRWLELAAPPQGLQKAPVCPLCRGPINCLRYGRVFKRADLDLSEQNVANNSQRAISSINRQSGRFDVDQVVKAAEAALKKLPRTIQKEDDESALPTHPLDVSGFLPVDSRAFGDRIQLHYRIPDDLAVAWKQAAQPLLVAYTGAVSVAKKRSAHMQAYEAAVTTLYRRNLEYLEAHPERLEEGSRPQAKALLMARLHCGLSAPPRADLRFRVEAFWASLSIRFLLLDLAVGMEAHIPTVFKGPWMNFASFIIKSMKNDAKIAIRIAEESQSHRQVIKTQVFLMQARYMASEHAVARHGDGASGGTLEELKEKTRNGASIARRTVAEARRAFRNAMQGRPEDQNWVDQNFVQPANVIIQKWEDLVTRLERGCFYSTVSTEEKKEILRAFMDGHLGFSTLQKLFREAGV